MAKLGVFLALLLTSMLAAGVFGALHNQISYSVGPDYFHQFKFPQFHIPEGVSPRIGAALVGWRASWWMGLIVGLPPFLLGLSLLSPASRLWAAGLRAIFAVLLLAAIASALGLVFGLIAIDQEVAAQIALPARITDPVGFLRAGAMHDASYIGGFLGVFAAVWVIFRASRP
ncbi:MAG: hypothetical protein ACWA49_11265 [Ruegeria sp.]